MGDFITPRDPKEVSEWLLSSGQSSFDWRFIPDYRLLKKVTDKLKKLGKKIVLTQGVYDLIHEGHALYLEKAKSLGDVLLVGVDSDELTRRRKGPRRPIVPQEERLRMLTYLRSVDLITVKEAHHGLGDLIRVVKPDVFVVSKSTRDFTPRMTRQYKKDCGRIVCLPPQATTSTSARIRSLNTEGAENLSRQILGVIDSFLGKSKD